MELENIPSGRREVAVVVHDKVKDGGSGDDSRWDTAFNRHRQNFLRIKSIFGAASSPGGEDVENPFQGDHKGDWNEGEFDVKNRGRRFQRVDLGSPSSPDSAGEEVDRFFAAPVTTVDGELTWGTGWLR